MAIHSEVCFFFAKHSLARGDNTSAGDGGQSSSPASLSGLVGMLLGSRLDWGHFFFCKLCFF